MTNTLTKFTPLAHNKRAAKPEASVLSRADQELADMEAYIVKITSSKKEARAFLTGAGIIDKTGQLNKHYRP